MGGMTGSGRAGRNCDKRFLCCLCCCCDLRCLVRMRLSGFSSHRSTQCVQRPEPSALPSPRSPISAQNPTLSTYPGIVQSQQRLGALQSEILHRLLSEWFEHAPVAPLVQSRHHPNIPVEPNVQTNAAATATPPPREHTIHLRHRCATASLSPTYAQCLPSSFVNNN